jgi:sugar lactone lactonase YvrE
MVKSKMKIGPPAGILIPLAALLLGCLGTTPPTLGPGPAATPIPATPALPSTTQTPAPIPAIIPNPRLLVLAENLPEPDDLLPVPDGSIYLSDVGDGTVRRFTADGRLEVILSGLDEPEGMVILPDGSLVIAEQGANRLVRYDFSSGTLQPFLNLANTTDQLGVDGLAFDSQFQAVIVPDSPNGRILRVSADGQSVTEIASGFVRPTGAWVEPDGAILVVDENGNSLNRLRPDGTVEKLAELSIPDDVIEDASGNIFVNTIGDNAIHLIAGASGEDRILVEDLIDPQGIAFDADGNLIATDSGHHRLVKIFIH